MVKPLPPSKSISISDSTLLESDEEDEDFKASSGSDSDSSDSENEDERVNKKVKLNVIEEPSLTKDDVDDLWASFNTPDEPIASTSTSTSSATAIVTSSKPKKITITTSYQFVGETVIQEKEVLADSIEAKTWLASQPLLPSSSSSSTLPSTTSTSAEEALFGSPSSSSLPTTVPETVSIPTTVAVKIGPPKRAKGGLAALAGGNKVAKLNTLEKSKLDWNKFVAKEDLSDDLTKARKDGYLEKQDFLQRTEDRKEEEYDKVKAARGRR